MTPNENEMQAVKNPSESIDLIEEAIHKKQIKYYEYKHFRNIQKIDYSNAFGKIYRANWKNSERYITLKSFFKFNNNIAKEILHELELQREVDLYNNVLRLYGITNKGQNGQSKKYLLIMEYADGSSLHNYLKENFENLTWDDKYKLAYQLVCTVSCLHDERIIHRDLNSNNILVHQNNIKLIDFGLSKRIKEISKQQSDLFGIVPYADPKRFIGSNNLTQQYSLNEKSDVYSVGVLLWEISSGHLPFENESYDAGLVMRILQGYRESIIPGTHVDYSNLYTECWDGEPDHRPVMKMVVDKLKLISINENSTTDIDIKKIEPEPTVTTSIDPSVVTDDLVNLIFKELNEGENRIVIEQHVMSYLNNNKITLQKFYDWLLNNQNSSNSIYLLGYFNYYGIEIDLNKQKAIELYQKAADLENSMAQLDLTDIYIFGKYAEKYHNVAFELSKKLANKECPYGIYLLGYCYFKGIGIDVDKQETFKLYQKAANLGNSNAMNNLGYCYFDGVGTNINKQKAFELFQKAADLGNTTGMTNLANCYRKGVETDVDKQKAFELYQKAANLENKSAQYKLAEMFENGDGIKRDIDQAIYWYKKSAEQGHEVARDKLKSLLNE